MKRAKTRESLSPLLQRNTLADEINNVDPRSNKVNVVGQR